MSSCQSQSYMQLSTNFNRRSFHTLRAYTYVIQKKRKLTILLHCRFIGEVIQEPSSDPCVPSPCGLNAQCKTIGESPSCSCLPEFTGSPPNCRPECISNTECPNHLACINQKCKDPCPGVCGTNSECRVVSHTPNCVCIVGYVGDPFSGCILPPSKLTFLLLPKLKNIYTYCTYIALIKIIPHQLKLN